MARLITLNPDWVAYLEDTNADLKTQLADALDEIDRLRRLVIQVEQICNVALP